MENGGPCGEGWNSLPNEILREILNKVELQSGYDWPGRRSVVASAGVCRTWRNVVLDMIDASRSIPHALTFPADLKATRPGDSLTECYIVRNGRKGLFHLYLGSKPTMSKKFLLAAKKCSWHPSTTDYIVSTDSQTFSRSSDSCIGVLRANFLNSKFSIHDVVPFDPDEWTPSCTISAGRRFPPSTHIGSVNYAINVTGPRGPRRIHCSLESMSSQAVSHRREDSAQYVMRNSSRGSRVTVPLSVEDEFKEDTAQKSMASGPVNSSKKLVLRNKQPIWHEQHQCWCLDFRGRVTEASVKNFQLIEGNEETSDSDRPVLLQFGKISKNTFTMDYRCPLTVFQAFVICLTSFETKVSCD